MKEVTIKVYEYSELSNEAKERAKRHFEENGTFDYIFEEAHLVLTKFCNTFDIQYKNIDYLQSYRNEYRFVMEDKYLDMSGKRLIAHIWSHYGYLLQAPEYVKSWWRTDEPKVHRNIFVAKIERDGKTEYNSTYRSSIFYDTDWLLTGIWLDEYVMQPIIYLVRIGENYDDTFEDILNNCIKNLCIGVEKAYYEQLKDDNVEDFCKENDYLFYENGDVYYH